MFIKIERNTARSGRVVLILLAVVLFGLMAVQACIPSSQSIISDGQEATTGVDVGDLAPDFTLADMAGNQLSLSDFRGKTVFVNFWATWCPPCRAEMPEIEAIYQEYKDKDVVVIGVNLFEPDDLVLQYIQEGGYSWIFVTDTTGVVTANYEVKSIPTSFFIDKEGIIRWVSIGAMSKRAIEANLDKAME